MPYARLHFFVSFMEKKPCIKFYDVFDRFLRTYEVATFPEISDVTRADEDANCGLHVNFWNFLFLVYYFGSRYTLNPYARGGFDFLYPTFLSKYLFHTHISVIYLLFQGKVLIL